VVVTAEPDGMGTLWAMLTATDAAGAFTWLTRLARGLGAEDPRSMDARRADILAALLNGRLLHVAHTDTGDADTGDADTETGADAASDGGEADGGEAGEDRAAGGSPDRTDGVTESVTDRSDFADFADFAVSADVAASPGRPIQPVTPGKPLIQVVVSYSTLIGADDQPAELVARPHPRLPRPRGGRRRGVAPAGHRPPVGHPARPRPHYLPPTGRARRPHQSPGRPLQVLRLPQTGNRRRARPRHRLVRRRHHQRAQPRRVLHPSPPAQTTCRLARRRPPRRPVDLDHPHRAPTHHAPHDYRPDPALAPTPEHAPPVPDDVDLDLPPF
jgi:hypothetical protein